MANQEPDEERVKVVQLFESAHRGMGDALAVTRHRYHRTHGSIDARWPGQVRMGLKVSEIVSNNHSRTPVFAQEWFDTDGTTPAVFYLVGAEYFKLLYGAGSEVSSDLLISGAGANAAALATSGARDDDGSGVPYIYVGFGPSAQVMRRIALDQTISTIASSDVYANLLLSLNGRLYRTVTPSGGTQPCAVSVCPLGADRMDSATWSAGQVVGFAGTPITALASVRLAPVALKPEGIFAYNEAAMRWVNRAPAWERYPHPRNGIGAFSLGDVLIAPLGEGGAVIFDGYRVWPFDPHAPEASPNLHTTSSTFLSMGTLKHFIAGATVVSDGSRPGSKMISAGSSLLFYEDAANESATVRAGSASTVTIGVASTVYVGWTHPFAGIYLYITSANTTAGTLTLAVGTGAASWGTVAHRDFTQIPHATTLGQTGSLIFTADPVAAGWVKNTVNSVEAYWVRITGIPANATIRDCQLLPWSPSIDTTNYPLDGLDRSGALPHILLGELAEGGAAPIWHDGVTIPKPDSIGALLFCNVGGTNLNRYRNLVAIGRFSTWRLDVAPDDHAGTLGHPFLNDIGLFEAPAIVPVPGKLCRLRSVKILGQEFDPNLPLRFYYTWDSGKPWNKAPGAVLRSPGELTIMSPQRGYLFRWAIGWYQSSAAARPTQPAVTAIEAEFEAVEDVLDSAQERSMQTRPRF